MPVTQNAESFKTIEKIVNIHKIENKKRIICIFSSLHHLKLQFEASLNTECYLLYKTRRI